MNKKTVSFQTKTKKTIPLKIVEKKTLSFQLIIKRSFDLIIQGVASVERYLLRLTNTKIIMSIVSRLNTLATATISVGKYNFSVSTIKENLKMFSALSNNVPITFYPRENKKIQNTLDFQMLMSIATKNLLPEFLSVSLGTYVLTSTPVLRVYFLLEEYASPVTLGNMDTQTLGELSYVES